MKVCVLGATGFIGGHIARACVQSGWQVRALRRRPDRTGNIPDLPVEWIPGDLSDPDALLRAFAGCAIGFHAAAFYPTKHGNTATQVAYAVAEMRRVLVAARAAGLQRLIYTSTLTTVGPPGEPDRLAEERDYYLPGTLPDSAYYEAKYAMECEAFRACLHGLPVVVLNPTAVFGPGDVKPTTGGVILVVAKGWAWGWIDAVANVVDVREVAAAHVAAAQEGRVGERYLVGGHNLHVREIMTVVAQVAGVPPPRFCTPGWLVSAVAALGKRAPFLGLPVNHLQAISHWQPLSCDKALRELGVAPRPFEETARDALSWFRQHGYY